MTRVSLRVNARDHTAEIEPRTSLADCLRDELLLTGTHLGCEHGVCGACTLMLDGRPVRSCITLAAACAGADVRTVEGFDDDALMAAIRQSFSKHHALQCGYCTPGMLVTAYDIVRRLPHADEARIRLELAGNLCRCTGYAGIVAAIADVLRDPPPAQLVPMMRAALAGTTETAQAATPEPAESSSSTAIPDSLENGTTLARTIPLDVPADRVWPLLRSVEQVARLLPGAAVTKIRADHVEGRFTASLGPMRASFAGRARVTYDDDARSGRVAGTGGEGRSGADGILAFRVDATSAQSCAVETTLTYRLRGPLAQVGRPAIVAGFVDQILARFAANLAAASGGAPVDRRPIGGLTALREALVRTIRRLLRRA